MSLMKRLRIGRQSIFIKIYLSFWIATILVIAAQISLDRLTQSGPPVDHFHRLLDQSLSLYGQTVLDAYLKGLPLEPADSGNPSDPLWNSIGIKTYLVDQANHELRDLPLSPEISLLAARTIQSGRPEHSFSKESPMVAVRITGADGIRYAVIGELPKNTLGPRRENSLQMVVRSCIVLLVSGGVCYLFARSFTSPIVKMREATRRLASGELSVRIGKSVGKRSDELSDLANDFDRMAERIETLMTLQRQLLGDISHELRSPLARLNVALELARQKTGPEASKELDRIEQEAESLNEMIGQVLMLTRMESNTEGFETASVNLTELIQEIAKDGDFEAQGSGRRVRMIRSDLCVIQGNEELLRRAIENTVRNAIRYTHEGTEVEISIEKEEHQSISHAVVSVRDHGDGAPDSELVNLFRPFYRVSTARERKTGGSGLGLAITERAVLWHHGFVQAHNADDSGLIIVITLPLTSLS